MNRTLLLSGLARVLTLVISVGGCAPIPGDLPAREIREDFTVPPLRAEFVGKFELAVPESRAFWEADPRNAVLQGDVLTVLYGDGAAHRVVSVDSASGKVLFDSSLFRDENHDGFLRVRDGQLVLLWDSDGPPQEPACPSLRYERARRPEGAKAWMRPQEVGPYMVWSESWSLGNPHIPLVYHTDLRVEIKSATDDSWARFTKSLTCNAWAACVKDDVLWVVDGGERDDAEVLTFRGTGFAGRFSTSLKLTNPRIFSLGDGVAVVGQGERDYVEVLDPAKPDRRVRVTARWFESGSDGRRLFICGDNGDGKGPFLCAGTPDSDAWQFARIDQGWSPADGFFIAPEEDKLVFGWISGRTLVVFRVAIP